MIMIIKIKKVNLIGKVRIIMKMLIHGVKIIIIQTKIIVKKISGVRMIITMIPGVVVIITKKKIKMDGQILMITMDGPMIMLMIIMDGLITI